MAFPATLDLVWEGGDDTAPTGQADAIYRGDDYFLTVTHEDDVGAPINVSGRTVLAQVRTHPDSTDILATFTVDDSNAATGVVVLSIGDAESYHLQPGEWYWDYQEVNSGQVSTIIRGQANVVGDVSRS